MRPPARSRAAGPYSASRAADIEALTRKCPTCGAEPKHGCRDPRSKVYDKPIRKIHSERKAGKCHTQGEG